jgi:hypothetical protein
LLSAGLASAAPIFLNLEVGGYCYERLQANSASSLPDLVEGILGLAELHPKVRVLGSDGKRLPGTEVVTFSNGPVAGGTRCDLPQSPIR